MPDDAYIKYLIDKSNPKPDQSSKVGGLAPLPAIPNAPSMDTSPLNFRDYLTETLRERAIEDQERIEADNILKADEYTKNKPGVVGQVGSWAGRNLETGVLNTKGMLEGAGAIVGSVTKQPDVSDYWAKKAIQTQKKVEELGNGTKWE
jgi:hypothetical protein